MSGRSPAGYAGEREPLPPGVVPAAVLIAAIWGFNFVVIKAGVAEVPPLMLAALRFLFSSFPAVFFVPRPRAPLGRLALYGLLLGVGEFGFLFTALKLGAPAGLSSILLQSQAFFTALLGALFLGERLPKRSVAGMAVAAAGLAVFAIAAARIPVAAATGHAAATGFPPHLLGMVLAAAFCWAGANVVARTIPAAGGLGLMVWSSLFSPVPLAALSFLFEGPGEMWKAIANANIRSVGALAYLVVLSTLVGYGLWNRLIMRHGAGRIAQFSLVVPVFALLASTLVLGERFGAGEAAASCLVFAGLLIHVSGRRKPAGP